MKISLEHEGKNYYIRTTNNKGLNECKAYVESKYVGERLLTLHNNYYGKTVRYDKGVSKISNIGIVDGQELLYTRDGWRKVTSCQLI